MNVGWVRRPSPLEPIAVTGRGSVATRLAARILAHGIGDLRGFAAEDTLFVTGADLPWVDGVTYLGVDPVASALWTPTLLGPSHHPALVLRAIQTQLGLDGAVAVLPAAGVVLPVSRARRLDRSALGTWMDR